MHTRDPEKFHWYRLQKDVPAEEEGELEEEEDEEVQEQEPQQELDFDDELDPEWELEQDDNSDLSMYSEGTSNELGAHWQESDDWSDGSQELH